MNELTGVTLDNDTATLSMPVGKARVSEWRRILDYYKSAKSATDDRVIAAENWWRMHNTIEASKETDAIKNGGYTAKTAWLHNTICNKHADYMDAYPEPIALPREPGDAEEAKKLSAILPYVFEQTNFQQAYSRVGWQKFKHGTGVYKTIWDQSKQNGLGDISIDRVSILNIFWEPGIENIQDSSFVFQVTPKNKVWLENQFPQLKNKLKSNGGMSIKQFVSDTKGSSSNEYAEKYLYVEVYYKLNGLLHYATFVPGYEDVLFASENEPENYPQGFYNHGLYPYDFDVLWPLEDELAGYGMVDVYANPQIGIDMLKTNIIENAIAGATPRYFVRTESGLNEADFMNLNKKLVHLPDLSDMSIRAIDHKGLDSTYVAVLQESIQELRETSGNTETAAGNTSNVDSAAGIAALQEASGKSSRDSTKESYRVFRDISLKVIELIRQFWDLPRTFRVVGELGEETFVSYSNEMIQPMSQGSVAGMDMGYTQPLFDIQVKAQKQNAYSSAVYNDLAMQLYSAGFFNPQYADQAVSCLQMMDFVGKDRLIQRISQNGMMAQKMSLILQYAMQLAEEHGDANAIQQLAEMAGVGGNYSSGAAAKSASSKLTAAKTAGETRANNSRERAANAALI